MSIEKKLRRIVRQVVALADKYPDAKYVSTDDMCYYDKGIVENGPPDSQGCLIGQGTVGVANLQGQEGPAYLVLRRVLLTYHEPISRAERHILGWLTQVQDNQDAGYRWELAVKHADRTFERNGWQRQDNGSLVYKSLVYRN